MTFPQELNLKIALKGWIYPVSENDMGHYLHAVLTLFLLAILYPIIKSRVEGLPAQKRSGALRSLRLVFALAALSPSFTLLTPCFSFVGGKLIAPFSLINRTVSTINKDSPRMLDGGVRRERAERVTANEIRFIMTFVEVSAKQFDHSNWENNIRPWAKTKLLAQPDTQDLLKQGIKLVYRFSGNDGKQVDEFSLSPGDLNL